MVQRYGSNRFRWAAAGCGRRDSIAHTLRQVFWTAWDEAADRVQRRFDLFTSSWRISMILRR